jgi:hypothetical protein
MQSYVYYECLYSIVFAAPPGVFPAGGAYAAWSLVVRLG